jgi:hypothetical protein
MLAGPPRRLLMPALRLALAFSLLALAACAPDSAETPAHGTPPPPADEATPSADRPAESAPDSAADSVLVGDPPTAVPGPLTAPPRTWTARSTDVAPGRAGVAVLQEVRAARHEGFDRVVFAFDGALPGYQVEYVDRPAHACGSGEEVYLDGEAWLRVRFVPAQAHTEAGTPTVAERRPRFDLPVLREAALTCDFEADVAWVLGLSTPGGYRLTELADPARLVVDLRR